MGLYSVLVFDRLRIWGNHRRGPDERLGSVPGPRGSPVCCGSRWCGRQVMGFGAFCIVSLVLFAALMEWTLE
nr:MAG TPA: hypothetical protein [Caudoviricetes sp.]